MIHRIISSTKTPLYELSSFKEHLNENQEPFGLLDFIFSFSHYWEDSDISTTIRAVYFINLKHNDINFLIIPLNDTEKHSSGITIDKEISDKDGTAFFNKLARSSDAHIFNNEKGFMLQPVVIPKPWGQEIWFTGIEKRGVSKGGPSVKPVPLPFLLYLYPYSTPDIQITQPILVKILDTLPQDSIGDLYYELHTEKKEAYIVTNISKSSWPKQKGEMHLGFSEDKISQYTSEKDFLYAFKQAIHKYKQVRDSIDSLFDKKKAKEGIAPQESADAKRLQSWMKKLPADLLDKEQILRKEMDSFKGKKQLCTGDVVNIPTHVPHSLRHGIKVLEFQTPHYERMIISFYGKVLTQNSWDTDTALSETTPSLVRKKLSEINNEIKSSNAQRIIDFPDFYVEKITITKESPLDIKTDDTYKIVYVLEGAVCFSSQQNKHHDTVPQGHAFFLPSSTVGMTAAVSKCSKTVIVCAVPKPL
jgi:quercetin dioxygenase-like cupin family protein